MGKPTGFLEYQRKTTPAADPAERTGSFDEFHLPLDPQQRREQAARCMNCGVPFCQSGMMLGGMITGCPLHNLIPEWNDEIYRGNPEQALFRLLKTNNFPEFTGRVCPAPCEAACTCGLNDAPVTIRENELSIIETGFEAGLMQPRPPRVRTDKRVAVIGSGPAGLAAADQLNRRGHLVTVFEKEDRPGGLLMYGIPNMKLDKRVIERRIRLMEAEGITFQTNTAIGTDLSAESLLSGFDAVLLCCGAGQPRDLALPGRDAKGIYFAVDFLTAATKALLQQKSAVPGAKGKRVVVVGGGDTGNDCVASCIRQGCKSVIQLEMMPRPPRERQPDNPWPQWPRILKTDYGQQEAIAVFGKDPRIFETTVTAFLKDAKGALRGIQTTALKPEQTEDGRLKMIPVPGSAREIKADLLLIAAGFTGPQAALPAAFQTPLSARGNIETVEGGHQTANPKIFAAGDCRTGQSLVVRAIAEGRAAAREADCFLMGYTNMI